MWCATDNENRMCHISAKGFLDLTLASLHVGCTTYPERSAITYQYHNQPRFFGSVNSGYYYISPTYHIYCSQTGNMYSSVSVSKSDFLII